MGTQDVASVDPEPSPLVLDPVPVPDPKETHTRERERVRHPDVGAIGRRVWDHGAKAAAGLARSNVTVPSWPIMHDASHKGWLALLDRIGEQLVNATPEQAEKVCRNRIDVAAAKALKEGDGNWFACTSLFTPNSFSAFAHLDPKQFERKQPKGRAAPTYGASKPNPHQPAEPSMRTGSDVFE